MEKKPEATLMEWSPEATPFMWRPILNGLRPPGGWKPVATSLESGGLCPPMCLSHITQFMMVISRLLSGASCKFFKANSTDSILITV